MQSQSPFFLTHLKTLLLKIHLAGPLRIELKSSDLEAEILPLNYGPLVHREGIEPSTFRLSVGCSQPLSYRWELFLVGAEGFEPPLDGLKVRCANR